MQRTIYYLNIIVLFALLLTGCKSLNDAPITHLYVMDFDHNVCSKRIITDKNTLSSRWVADLPVEACDGYIGLESKEFLNLRTYLKNN